MQVAGGLVAEVYVDILLAVNLVMDFFILWAAGRLANLRIRVFRVVLGALLGACYSLVVFLPEHTLLTTLGAKILCSLLMLVVSYWPLGFKAFLRSVIYLYLVSFAMGGAVMGASFLLDGNPGYLQAMNGVAVYQDHLSYRWLLFGIGIALIMGMGGLSLLRKNWIRRHLTSRLVISLMGHRIGATALLDTGNHLVDPLTKKPVIVAEYSLFNQILPKVIQDAIAGENEPVLQGIANSLAPEWAARIRFIPYNSVGKRHGLMIGIRPDNIEIKGNSRQISSKDVVIGLTDKPIATDGYYQALLHPDLFDLY